MANVFEEYGLDLIMNQNKVSKKQESDKQTQISIDQKMHKLFQILQKQIMTSDIIIDNIKEFSKWFERYLPDIIHRYEKEVSCKID